MVTIKDIASMANVSRGTVDRVLNNRGGVSPRTAERIRLIAEKMNYTPSITGRESMELFVAGFGPKNE